MNVWLEAVAVFAAADVQKCNRLEDFLVPHTGCTRLNDPGTAYPLWDDSPGQEGCAVGRRADRLCLFKPLECFTWQRRKRLANRTARASASSGRRRFLVISHFLRIQPPISVADATATPHSQRRRRLEATGQLLSSNVCYMSNFSIRRMAIWLISSTQGSCCLLSSMLFDNASSVLTLKLSRK